MKGCRGEGTSIHLSSSLSQFHSVYCNLVHHSQVTVYRVELKHRMI